MRQSRLLAMALVIAASAPLWGVVGDTDKGQPKKDPLVAKWEDHMGKLPFVIGFEKGMAEAKFSGRPMLLFFTATW